MQIFLRELLPRRKLQRGAQCNAVFYKQVDDAGIDRPEAASNEFYRNVFSKSTVCIAQLEESIVSMISGVGWTPAGSWG